MYGAYKGIEALGRASTIIFFFIISALIILLCTLIPQADLLNVEPITMHDSKDVAEIAVNMISKNSCIPALAILLPFTRGNSKKGIVWWAVAVYLSTALLILIITAVLGDYLETQIFPVYSITALASLGVTERLDGLFLGVWTAGMFLKVSLFMYLLSACVKRIFGETISRWSILICGVLVLGASMGISAKEGLFQMIFNNNLMLILTLITGVVIPLMLSIINKIKVKGD
jgi:spore germination protein KB